jgi:hypothetical protein
MRAILAAALLATVAAPAAAAPREAWFAIVAGVNRPLLPGEKPLRFADNDALKYYELFRTFRADAAIFTEIDDDSRGYPAGLIRETRSPRKGAVMAAFAQINRRIADLRRRDPAVVTRFFFVFSGHGGEDEVGGYLNILDDDGARVVKLTKLELWRDVLARSRAHLNHVIIDACSSGAFVTAKDSAGRRRKFGKAWRAFLRRVRREKEAIARAFQRTTFFVSSDALVKSHEYGEFQGGVFTHELLSALKGAADLDGDGRVTYPEIRAFLATANARAQVSGVYGVRLQANLVVPPALARGAFLDYARLPPVPRLTLERGLAGRFFLVDDKNHRYADFHKSAEYALKVALLPRPRYFLYFEAPDGRREFPIALGDVERARTVASLDGPARVVGYGERGPVEEAFQHLFEQPLFASAVGEAERAGFTTPEAYLREHLRILDEIDASRRRWRWTFYGLGAAAAAASGYFAIQAIEANNRLGSPRTTQITAAGLVQSRDRNLLGMGLGLGAAAGAFLTAVFAFGEEKDPAPGPAPRASVGPGPGTAGVAVQIRY